MLYPIRVNAMTKLLGTFALSAAMVLVPALSRAQEDPDGWTEPIQPAEAPPAPPYEAPPAPEQAQAAAPTAGQWVYTQQYGWIWMPYSDAYMRVPANGYGEPYAYVYYPAYGCWSWLAAPWVWGIGPWPTFGVYGPARFAWYGHGWWRFPQRWHYAPARAGYGGYGGRGYIPSRTYRGGAGWAPSRTTPYLRSGSGTYRGSAPSATYGGRAALVGRGQGGGFAAPNAGWTGRGSGGVGHAAPAGGGGFTPRRGSGGGRSSGGGQSAGGHGAHGRG